LAGWQAIMWATTDCSGPERGARSATTGPTSTPESTPSASGRMSTGIKRDKREITAVFHPAKEDYSAHWPDAINAERAGDVLEALLADIDKLGVDLAADVAESIF